MQCRHFYNLKRIVTVSVSWAASVNVNVTDEDNVISLLFRISSKLFISKNVILQLIMYQQRFNYFNTVINNSTKQAMRSHHLLRCCEVVLLLALLARNGSR